jgi:hypothetical protein
VSFLLDTNLCSAVFVPPGLEPGDSYHLVFVTRVARDATLGEIGVYDAFVNHVGLEATTPLAERSPGQPITGPVPW